MQGPCQGVLLKHPSVEKALCKIIDGKKDPIDDTMLDQPTRLYFANHGQEDQPAQCGSCCSNDTNKYHIVDLGGIKLPTDQSPYLGVVHEDQPKEQDDD